MSEVKIVGVRSFKNKKNGRIGYTYYFTEDFSDYEEQSSESCLGVSCGNEFSYQDFNVMPGDVVNFVYGKGFEGRAVLQDIQVVKPVMVAKS